MATASPPLGRSVTRHPVIHGQLRLAEDHPTRPRLGTVAAVGGTVERLDPFGSLMIDLMDQWLIHGGS